MILSQIRRHLLWVVAILVLTVLIVFVVLPLLQRRQKD